MLEEVVIVTVVVVGQDGGDGDRGGVCHNGGGKHVT